MASGFRSLGRWASLTAVAASAWLGGLAPARADVPRAARWVARDAAIYLEIRRPEDVLERLTDERFQAMLRAVPGYEKSLRNADFRNLRAVVDSLADALGTTWQEGLANLTGDGIVLAVEGERGERPLVYALVTPRDPAFLARAHATLLELARKDAADKGKPDPVERAEYRGIAGYRLGDGPAHAIVEGTLVISDRDATLRKVVDRVRERDEAGSSIADEATWTARRAQVEPEALAWGLVRLDRLRELDPKRFTPPERTNPAATLLFGPWVEAIREAPWASASLTWSADRLGAELTLPTPPEGYSEPSKRFLPSSKGGAPGPIRVPGAIACASLWRDPSAIWEVRADLFPPELVQNLAKLDTFAGQYFGGRDFGTGVLGALDGDWRLVVARQDYGAMEPVPDLKLPAFALVVGLRPGDDDFAQRLKVAFQSFVGLANIGSAQTKAPPLMLGSETADGVTIATARFMLPKVPDPKDEPVHPRHNFSPSMAQVDEHFILSSSVGLTRELVKALKGPADRTDLTVLAEADGTELARLVEINRPRLVMQNMVEKGNDKAAAEKEVGLLADLLRYLGHATLSARDGAEAIRFRLDFAIDPD